MEQTKLALSAVMIVAVGLIGTNFVTGLEMTDQEKINAYEDSSPIYGHITIVHSDPDGNVLAYIQTDNVVTDDGLNCLAERAFGAGDSTCDGGSSTDLFNEIGLFDESETFAAGDVFDTNALVTDGDADGLGIGSADSVKEDTGSNGATNGVITDIVKTFTAGPGTVTNFDVDGAGLFNAAGDVLFAAQSFNLVSLNTDDTLTITWSIELG